MYNPHTLLADAQAVRAWLQVRANRRAVLFVASTFLASVLLVAMVGDGPLVVAAVLFLLVGGVIAGFLDPSLGPFGDGRARLEADVLAILRTETERRGVTAPHSWLVQAARHHDSVFLDASFSATAGADSSLRAKVLAAYKAVPASVRDPKRTLAFFFRPAP